MIRVFGHTKTKQDNQKDTEKTPQDTLLEQALNFEKQRNFDLQNRIEIQEKQILELLSTIKELSQGIKRLEAPKSEQNQQKRKKIF